MKHRDFPLRKPLSLRPFAMVAFAATACLSWGQHRIEGVVFGAENPGGTRIDVQGQTGPYTIQNGFYGSTSEMTLGIGLYKSSLYNPRAPQIGYGSGAFGSFYDTLTFAGGTGTGFVRVAYDLTGTFDIPDGGGAGFNQITVDIYAKPTGSDPLTSGQVPGGGDLYGREQVFPRLSGAYGISLLSDPISFEFGSPLTYQVYTAVLLAGKGTADFSHTGLLKYLRAVDANGNPINGVTVGSSAGVSYTINPVPEPASLAALGFGALTLLRRRNRARLGR